MVNAVMLHHAPLLQRLFRRPIQLGLLLAMAWLMGLSGGFHSHAAQAPGHSTLNTAQAPVTIAEAAPCSEEHCILCDWKAHTPYAPTAEPQPATAGLVSAERSLTPTRAPPTGPAARFHGRAPPHVLFHAFTA
ncbi:hypothetical protein D3C86_1780960 [compost metagenome]